MPKIKGHIRRSQLITTYGVASVIPVGDEAFMVAALNRWDVGAADLHEPRLQRELRVNGFVQPPAGGEERPDVPVVRFPTFQSCPVCRRLARHKDFTHFDLNDCPDCSQPLVPSRFVVACERGHIDDFPYDRWVHFGRQKSDGQHNLTISTTGATASLAGVVITCTCGAERTMEDAFDRFALQDVTSCRGRHPWLRFEGEPCDALPRTLQRGASSVWFGDTRSALSIPPWSESASRALDSHWPTLRHLPMQAMPPVIESMKLAEKTGFTKEELLKIAEARKQRETGETSGSTSMRGEEYDALVRGRKETTRDQDFATRAAVVPDSLTPFIAQVQLVTRLREVRVLRGFSRIYPPRGVDGEQSNVVSIYDENVDWLPGIEVKGEGVFIRLADDAVKQWSEQPAVERRVAQLREQDRKRHEAWGVTPTRPVTPRFLLAHVFAHSLINRLALDAGYPAASLRERLFIDGDACALLVYTATTDSAGSLGGIISQATGPALETLVRGAIAGYRWCSADPVCIESQASGAEALNLAACHSCALLPETSCEEMNSFLDRALLVGLPDDKAVGFFGTMA